MTLITIDNMLTFAPNVGVLVHKDALAASPENLFEAVKTAYAHMADEHLVNACHGGSGPLANVGTVTYERYLELLREIGIQEAGQLAKRQHTKIRRAAFNAGRSDLVLAMIEAGAQYVCAEIGCGVHKNLSVDHIVPLSRGGSDDLLNLRFLCQHHNSKKGDRIHPQRVVQADHSTSSGSAD